MSSIHIHVFENPSSGETDLNTVEGRLQAAPIYGPSGIVLIELLLHIGSGNYDEGILGPMIGRSRVGLRYTLDRLERLGCAHYHTDPHGDTWQIDRWVNLPVSSVSRLMRVTS